MKTQTVRSGSLMPLIYIFSNDNAFTHLKCKNYSHQVPKNATAYLHKLKIKKYEGEKE